MVESCLVRRQAGGLELAVVEQLIVVRVVPVELVAPVDLVVQVVQAEQ